MEERYKDQQDTINKLTRENHNLKEQLFHQKIDNFDSKVFHILTTATVSIGVTIATYFALTR